MSLTGVVALDGPSGTGKSTVAREMARRLAACYLDTGAMYRAVTWAVLRAGVDPADALAVTEIARRIDLGITTDPDDQQVVVDGQHVEAEIRSGQVTAAVSPVSAIPAVRRVLVAAQQRLIESALHSRGGIVVEGRDIGTVVAPGAGLKVYLTASDAERAVRRSRQNGAAGSAEVAATREALRRRDTFDSTRTDSPLRHAADAVEVDTTAMPVEAVVNLLTDLVGSRGMAGGDREGSGGDRER